VGGLYFDICNISMFELLAVPLRGMQYVQMGFRIVLLAVPLRGIPYVQSN
jgi:hypothetical protein